MKVGTDGVLLGAWTPVHYNPKSILDIGTGTGIIAIMLAQRTSSAKIDALEIDKDAYKQSVENFEKSPWKNRLFCFNISLDNFVKDTREHYDLIVSNPPFYTENFRSQNKQRNMARFADAMPFSDLIDAVQFLLSENGVFSVIIPFKEENNFIYLAKQKKIYPRNITRVRGSINSEIKRSLLVFSKKTDDCFCTDELILETARNIYTPEFANLTKEFYLDKTNVY